MRRKTIAFAGNCQAVALGHVYRMYIAPLREEAVTVVDLHPGLTEAVAHERIALIEGADVVVEQKFDFPSWIEPGRFEPRVERVSYPFVGGAFYWPFGGEAHVRSEPHPVLNNAIPYPGEIGDRVLNRMIREETPTEEAVRRYLDMDVAKASRIARVMEMQLDKQRQRDEVTGIHTAEFIAENFRRRKLFMTQGHPGLDLFRIVARQVFARLGAPYSQVEMALSSLRTSPFPRDEAPIHPALADSLGLTFAMPTSRYRFGLEGLFTFSEFATRYMDYVWDPELYQGIALAGGGTPGQAEPLLRASLRRSPGSAAGWRALGVSLAALGQFDAAHEAVDRAVLLEPADPDGPRARARVLLGQGRAAEAVKAAGEAIELFPLDPASHRILAEALARDSDLPGAVRVARHAAGLAPGDVTDTRLLANYLLQTGNVDEAVVALRLCLAREPGRDEVVFALADILYRGGRTEEALEVTRVALKLRPGDPHLHHRLGGLLGRLGDHAGAEAAHRAAIELDPGVLGFHGGLADALEGQGRRAEAIAVVESALATGRGDGHMYNRLGYLLAKQGDLAPAEMAYRDAIARDATVVGFHLGLADVLVRQDLRDEAVAALRAFEASGRQDPHVQARLAHILGRQVA